MWLSGPDPRQIDSIMYFDTKFQKKCSAKQTHFHVRLHCPAASQPNTHTQKTKQKNSPAYLYNNLYNLQRRRAVTQPAHYTHSSVQATNCGLLKQIVMKQLPDSKPEMDLLILA